MCVNHNLFAMILPTKFIILGGKKLNKKNITLRIASITVCMATLLSNTNLSVFAESELTVSHFSYQNYDITYSLTNHWDDKYQGNIIIKNTSDDIIHDWCLAFLSDNNIDYAWNGIVEKYENLTFIHNNTYNQDILPGDTIEVGFIESADEINIPSKYDLISEPTVASTEDYTTEFKVVNDWETGYTATFTIINTSDETLEDWSLEFDWDNNIDTIWNAEIASHNEYHYVINNASYNQNIAPGSSITISFQNNNSGNIETKPGNITLSEYGYVRREAINTLLNVRNVSLDLSAFEYNDEGYYLVEDEISSLSGIIRPGLLAVSGNYSIENAWGTVLAEGEFAPESNWCIHDIGFVLGMNKVTVDVKFSDDSASTVTAWFMNYNENNMKNIAIDNDDTDGDGLSNYLESIYGTDPLLPDTDGDGLTDYQELVDTGTDPLVVDSDNDGILDGRDDCDKDGIDTITEYQFRTDPFCIDTDGDGLNDYEELYTYNTDPLKDDTDGDGADDKWELDNGYDPLVADEFFTVIDTVEGYGNTAEITITTPDGSISTLKAEAVLDSPYINCTIPGYTGSAFDFTMDGEFADAELKITFDEALLEEEGFYPVIYYFNEETQQLEEIETEWDGVNNFVIAELHHFSTYILLNKTKFDEVFERDIELPEGTSTAPFEFVFAIDCSGSMGSKGANNDPQNIRLKVAKEFVDKLDEDDKGAVLSFGSGTTVLCEFTNDKTELKNAIDKVGNTDGNTYIGAAVDKSISLFSEPNGSSRYIILLTDGCPTDSMSADYASKAVSKDIKIITVGLGSGVDAKFLQQITNATFPNNEGLYYFASVAGELDVVYDKIEDDIKHEDPYLDSNNDGITDAQTLAFCNGTLTTATGVNPFLGYTYEEIQDDTDGDLDDDGLLNGEEVEISKYTINSKYVKLKTSPIDSDIDKDGFNDSEELKNGTDPYVFSIRESDVSTMRDSDRFMSSIMSQSYLEDTGFMIKLYLGDAIFNFKLQRVTRYQSALGTYIGILCDNLARQEFVEMTKASILKKIDDTYSYVINLNTAISSVPLSAATYASYMDTLTEFSNMLAGYRKAYSSFTSVSEFAKHNESLSLLIERVGEFSFEVDKAGMTLPCLDSYKFGGKLCKLPYTFTDSSKVAKALSKTGNVLNAAGYIAIELNSVGKAVSDCWALSSVLSLGSQYDHIDRFLDTVIKNTGNFEMKDAAINLSYAMDSDWNYAEVALITAIDDIVLSGGAAMLETYGLTELTPGGLAYYLGLTIADLMFNISGLDTEINTTIAYGDASKCLAESLIHNLDRVSDNYYETDAIGIEHINNLLQLRIVGENQFYVAANSKKISIEKLFGLLEETKSALEDNVDHIERIAGRAPALTITRSFPGSVL